MTLLAGQLNAAIWQARQDAAENDRLQAIAHAWDYYEGRHPLPLKVKTGQADDNVIVNLARPVVDKGISLLFGKEVTWQIDETAATTTGAEQFLQDVWTANDKMALLHEVGQNGGLAGLAAIKVNPKPDGTYRLVNLDPKNLRIFCEDEDIDEVWRYRIQYTCVGRDGGELVKRQDITKNPASGAGESGQSWTIQNYTASGADKDFKADGPPTLWPYPLAPIVHCKNLPCANSVWGYGDLEDVRLNDALNLIASTTRKILRLHGHPITVGKNINGALLSRDGGAFWELPNPDSDLYNLEMQSDLAAAREFYQTLRAAFYAMGRMPDLSQIGDLGALTNFGLRVLFADALERTATKRMLYGGLIVRINRLLCLLAGKGENVTTKLTWPDPLPTNAKENVETVAAEQATGLTSDETLTGVLGRDYADEQKRMAVERRKRQQQSSGPGSTGPRTAPDTLLPGNTPAGDGGRAAQLAQQAMTDAGRGQ